MNHKIINFPSIAIPLFILLIPVSVFGKAHKTPPDLFIVDGLPRSTTKLPQKTIKNRSRRVIVSTELLNLDSVTLNLFSDFVVTARRDRLIDRVKNHSTWVGHVDGQPDSEVFLTARGKTLSGIVRIGEDLFEIVSLGLNKHEIIKVDPNKKPIHSQPTTPEGFFTEAGQIDDTLIPMLAGKAASLATTGSSSKQTLAAGTIIDIMVVYTDKAKINASGQAGIEAKITNAVAQANQAYLNSEIDLQLNLVHMAETRYVETGDMPTSLRMLTGTTDGQMDEIHGLRNQYAADQVILVTADTNYCGISYVMSEPSVRFAPFAFSVVHDDSQFACLSDQVLAHELGHGQGSQHDRENAISPGAYEYSYGHRLCQVGGFRTIMSYGCNGGSLVSYFSNPNVTLPNGLITGTTTENNALSINNTKSIVASFRIPLDKNVPNSPLNLGATTLSANEISLTWTDNSNNEEGFRLERSIDGGKTWIEFAVTNINVVSFVDTGLEGSTPYQYRARSYNSNGNSLYSNNTSAVTYAAVVLPCIINQPTLLMSPYSQFSKSGSPLTYNIDLTNQDSTSCGLTSFTLSTSDGTVLGPFSLNAGKTLSTVWKTTVPSMGGNYFKFVTAIATGRIPIAQIATIIVDTNAPTAPGNLTAYVGRKFEVVVNWSPSTDWLSGIKHYVVKRNNLVLATTNNTSFVDGPGSGSFIYSVEAYDNAGNISNRSSVLVTVP